mgnify:CR=1 FL=1
MSDKEIDPESGQPWPVSDEDYPLALPVRRHYQLNKVREQREKTLILIADVKKEIADLHAIQLSSSVLMRLLSRAEETLEEIKKTEADLISILEETDDE